ncbi:hypothetical protein [Jeotgalicoccus sp. S0W5]|uniref:hypothetical protein n=1 Tax=Jeotgalicoccus sp. S0W5 TaxID=2527874 RepID=UPI001414E406|nr:hypothetical protein [Jeotgalicoccus sp. S0W5]
MNKGQTLKMAQKAMAVKKILVLENDYLNTVPNVKNLKVDEVLTSYMYLERALENMYELNQDLVDQLEDVAVYLYDLSNEEETENGSN